MKVDDLHYERHLVEVESGYACAVHQMYQNPDGIPVVMVHGAIENSGIFFSKNGRGFGPYLARNGFNVFVIDLRGKGYSRPRIKSGFKDSMDGCINNDLNKIYAFISKKVAPKHSWISVGHSWGGVLLMSHYARHADKFPIKKIVLFGAKRRVKINSLVKFRNFMFGFVLLGGFLGWLYGFAPFKTAMKFGTENEPLHYYHDMVRWVFSKKWIGRDGFDYAKAFKNKIAPKVLSITGSNDNYLGEKRDCENFILEAFGSLSKITTLHLSRKNGNMVNYGHNDMLSDKRALNDHFPIILEWINRLDTN